MDVQNSRFNAAEILLKMEVLAMEGFWETIRDWGVMLLKVFVVVFILDSGLYLLGYSFSIPFIRDLVVPFFFALGYSRGY